MSHENIEVTQVERANFIGWQVSFKPMMFKYSGLSPQGLSLDHFAELIVDGLGTDASITVFQAALMFKQSRSWFNSGIGKELISLRDSLCNDIKEVLTDHSNLEIFQVGDMYNIRVSKVH